MLYLVTVANFLRHSLEHCLIYPDVIVKGDQIKSNVALKKYTDFPVTLKTL